MEGLLWWLIIGGLFFFMMRHGCGAHAARGSQGAKDADEEVKHTDPVCGMGVDMNQGYGKMHDGQLYRFCSRKCLDRFEADSNRYLRQPAVTTGGAP